MVRPLEQRAVGLLALVRNAPEWPRVLHFVCLEQIYQIIPMLHSKGPISERNLKVGSLGWPLSSTALFNWLIPMCRFPSLESTWIGAVWTGLYRMFFRIRHPELTSSCYFRRQGANCSGTRAPHFPARLLHAKAGRNAQSAAPLLPVRSSRSAVFSKSRFKSAMTAS